jgi:stress-induced morphogen
MQIPKSPRRQKLREKQCLYPGCATAYFGYPNTKYCPEHRKAKHRIKKQIEPENVNIQNQTLHHDYTKAVTQVLTCAFEGCSSQFEIMVYPRQYIYPKYCPEHRNEYRRIQLLKQIGREDLVEAMKQEKEFVELGHAHQGGDTIKESG